MKRSTGDQFDRRAVVTIWDFAGSDIFGAMQRLYYTQAAVYVIVVNSLRSDAAAVAEHWFNTIQSQVQSPLVVLVGTYGDEKARSLFSPPFSSPHPFLHLFSPSSRPPHILSASQPHPPFCPDLVQNQKDGPRSSQSSIESIARTLYDRAPHAHFFALSVSNSSAEAEISGLASLLQQAISSVPTYDRHVPFSYIFFEQLIKDYANSLDFPLVPKQAFLRLGTSLPLPLW